VDEILTHGNRVPKVTYVKILTLAPSSTQEGFTQEVVVSAPSPATNLHRLHRLFLSAVGNLHRLHRLFLSIASSLPRFVPSSGRLPPLGPAPPYPLPRSHPRYANPVDFVLGFDSCFFNPISGRRRAACEARRGRQRAACEAAGEAKVTGSNQ
jgi:hypothetical protein